MIGLALPIKPTTTNKIITTIRYSFIITTTLIVWFPVIGWGYIPNKIHTFFENSEKK